MFKLICKSVFFAIYMGKMGVKKASVIFGDGCLYDLMIILYLNNFYIYRVNALAAVFYFKLYFIVLTDLVDQAG
jgi:hypothetical protein